jgi:hypothetical protein
MEATHPQTVYHLTIRNVLRFEASPRRNSTRGLGAPGMPPTHKPVTVSLYRESRGCDLGMDDGMRQAEEKPRAEGNQVIDEMGTPRSTRGTSRSLTSAPAERRVSLRQRSSPLCWTGRGARRKATRAGRVGRRPARVALRLPHWRACP